MNWNPWHGLYLGSRWAVLAVSGLAAGPISPSCLGLFLLISPEQEKNWTWHIRTSHQQFCSAVATCVGTSTCKAAAPPRMNGVLLGELEWRGFCTVPGSVTLSSKPVSCKLESDLTSRLWHPAMEGCEPWKLWFLKCILNRFCTLPNAAQRALSWKYIYKKKIKHISRGKQSLDWNK